MHISKSGQGTGGGKTTRTLLYNIYLQGWFWAAKQTNTDRAGSDFAYAQFQVLSSTEVRPICPAVRIVQLSTDFGTIRNCLAKLST